MVRDGVTSWGICRRGPERIFALLVCVVAILLGLPGLVAVARATPPAVTTTTDSNAPGSGSLRAAIAAANPGDTVVVPASRTPYRLTLGEITIAHAITIQGTGLGPDATVIEAMGSHRVFHVTNGVPSSGTVRFKDVEITKGLITARPGGGGILADAGKLSLDHVLMAANSAKVSGASNIGGGAIYSNGGNLTITDSTLTGNSVTAGGATSSVLGGGAVFNNGSGALTIAGSTISSNHTTIGASACCDGGAVLQNVSAAVSITDSHLDGNQFTETAGTNCCSGGGALYQDGNATVTITSTTLNQNKATVTDTHCCDGGGAVFMDTNDMQLLSVSDSTLSNDQTVVHTTNCCAGGGAINSFAQLHIANSTLGSDSANVTDTSCCDGGGAVEETGTDMSVVGSELSHDTATVHTSASSSGLDSCCQGGGAANIDDGSSKLSVASSEFSDNQASTNSSVLSGGGGLYAHAPVGGVTFTDSTVSGNSATAAAGTAGGGGLMVDRSPAALTFMTIDGNHMTHGIGGGVFENQSTLKTKNSMVALNTAPSGANCGAAGGATLTSSGHNLENSPDSCHFTGSGDKVVPAASIKLGPLGNYGGTTLTQELLPGSAAIDAVPLSFCTDQSTPTPKAVTLDQRGVPRPQPTGGACDIGAYEFGQANVSLSASASPSSVKLGQRTTLKFTVSDSGPVPATDTQLDFVLPSGAKFVSGTIGCAANVGGASCALATVSAGTPVTGSVVVATSKPGKLSVHASASATEPDPSAANNSRVVTLTVKALRPTLTHVSESHKRWREGDKPATLAKKRKKRPPLGTRFAFNLNEKAKVSLSFIETGKGKRGHLSFGGHAGRNSVFFDGITSGGHKLLPASYTLVITARAFGKKCKPAKLNFTILG